VGRVETKKILNEKYCKWGKLFVQELGRGPVRNIFLAAKKTLTAISKLRADRDRLDAQKTCRFSMGARTREEFARGTTTLLRQNQTRGR